MRISDSGEESNQQGPRSSIMDSIKAKSVIKSDDDNEAPKVNADIQSNKLKQLLGVIKQA
jgi:hypothetical protein